MSLSSQNLNLESLLLAYVLLHFKKNWSVPKDQQHKLINTRPSVSFTALLQGSRRCRMGAL